MAETSFDAVAGSVNSKTLELDYDGAVYITSYNSSSNYYTTPSAGMLAIWCSYLAAGKCAVYNLETNFTVWEGHPHCIFSGSYPSGSGAVHYVPVNKGAKIHQESNKGAVVWFIPYKT